MNFFIWDMIVQPPQSHNLRKNMTTMGKVDTFDLMMIIRWVMNIYSRSQKLAWASLTHAAPYDMYTFPGGTFCYVYIMISWWIRVVYLPIFIRVTSSTIRQSRPGDSPSSGDVSLKNGGESVHTKPQQNTTNNHHPHTVGAVLYFCEIGIKRRGMV